MRTSSSSTSVRVLVRKYIVDSKVEVRLVLDSAGLTPGICTSRSTHSLMISSESVSRYVMSIRVDLLATSALWRTNDIPEIFSRFFLGILSDPNLAGIIARIVRLQP
jgi:hypothetical protein